jgi:hypothetical protein
MPNVIYKFLFFGFFIVMALLEAARRMINARQLANTWLGENKFLLLSKSDIKINAFVWPVRVNVIVQNESGEKLSIVLRAGGFWGGVFSGVIKCESSKLAE